MAGTTIAIPATLRRSHALVTVTKNAASGLRARDDMRIEVGPRQGVAHLLVSRAQLHRALCVLQAVLSEAERRGYEVRAVPRSGYGDRAGVAIVIRGHAYPIEISELTERVPLSGDEIAAWKKKEEKRFRFSWETEREPPSHKSVANGYLRVSLPPRYTGARCNWSEGSRGGLEGKLPGLFAELERRAAEDDERARERVRAYEERIRREHERMEQERQARIERARATRLSEEIEAWRLAQEIRAYVAALRSSLDRVEGEDRKRITAWCHWAERFSLQTDPTLNLERVARLANDSGHMRTRALAQFSREESTRPHSAFLQS